MSRLTGSDVRSMMEAYNAVYAPQELTEEQVWEEVETWVNSLLEEGYDLSEYTWEEMYESYIEEQLPKVPQIPSMKDMIRRGKENVDTQAAFGRAAEKSTGIKTTPPAFSRPAPSAASKPDLDSSGGSGGGGGGGDGGGSGRGGSGTTKPPAAPKPAPAGQTGAKALATAAAEKARIRGTSETDNPLMKNMRSRMSAPTSAQSPDVAKLGKGNQSLVNNPNVAKPSGGALSQATAAASKPAAFNPTPTPTPAAAPKAPTRRLSAADQRQGIRASYEYDAYDLVLEYLLAEGHADTVEEANYVMLEMDAEMVQDIVEGGFNNSGRYDVGGGRTVGPVAGAVRALVSGNLPKQRTYVPPSSKQGSNRPPAVPTSKGDSGKLTDFGAGGGKAKMKTGMTVGQVERQGRMNKGDYSR
jgi:hypothetical protein